MALVEHANQSPTNMGMYLRRPCCLPRCPLLLFAGGSHADSSTADNNLVTPSVTPGV